MMGFFMKKIDHLKDQLFYIYHMIDFKDVPCLLFINNTIKKTETY